jgi:hypothetical protein
MDALRPKLIVSYPSLVNARPTLKGGIKNGEDFGKLSCLGGWRALLGPGPRRQQGSALGVIASVCDLFPSCYHCGIR